MLFYIQNQQQQQQQHFKCVVEHSEKIFCVCKFVPETCTQFSTEIDMPMMLTNQRLFVAFVEICGFDANV